MTGFCAAFDSFLDYSLLSVLHNPLGTTAARELTPGVVLVIPCRSLWDDQVSYIVVQLKAVGSASLSDPSGDVGVCPLASK
jgi:hypothetical protein